MIASGEITMRELARKHDQHARVYYRKHGRPTSEVERLAAAMRVACQVTGGLMPAERFGPADLRAARQVLIERGNCRQTINAQAKRIRTVFRWAVSMQIVPATTLVALECVAPLKRGRTEAIESSGQAPVEIERVQATAAEMPADVAAMVWLHWHTGMRSGELLSMRPADVQRPEGRPWVYTPRSHKCEQHGRRRVVVLGPRARQLLNPWLEDQGDPWLFPGLAAERLLWTNRNGRAWTPNAYRLAVQRACRRAGVSKWTPHQLRHAAATRMRRLVGLETTRAILGHSRAEVTEIYAERDMQSAIDAVELVG